MVPSISCPKKIIIFGRPGSGKSTFAAQLHQQTNTPLFHLDRIFFKDHWELRTARECSDLQKEILMQNRWIIDGNCITYDKVFEERFALSSIAIYFNFPKSTCFARILKRRFFKDKTILDRADNCFERIKFNFLKYMWNFHKRIAPLLANFATKFPNTLLKEVHSWAEIEQLKEWIFSECNFPISRKNKAD